MVSERDLIEKLASIEHARWGAWHLKEFLNTVIKDKNDEIDSLEEEASKEDQSGPNALVDAARKALAKYKEATEPKG